MSALDPPSPIQVPAAYGVVVEHLRRAIHLGVYSPGDRLPPERIHAKQLGVSRVTLREALRVLEGEGYLEMRRGASGGAMVIAQTQTRAALLQRLDELIAIQEFRAATESLAARRAATRIDEETLARLEEAIEALSAGKTHHEYQRADADFHLRIAEAADAPLLRDAVEDARAEMFPQFELMDYEFPKQSVLRGHRLILDALREGDPDAAAKRMTDHIETSTSELVAELERDA